MYQTSSPKHFKYLAIADRPDGFLRVVLDDGSLKINIII